MIKKNKKAENFIKKTTILQQKDVLLKTTTEHKISGMLRDKN
ncbi:8505_t:CDS:1, partial [Gigaspora rosea]